ncbi:MAG: flagellar hook-basal body complex protein FliE [Armatimonadetes bacterium]|nr:flagellar hook-basal body complex protein FliE [Armatimonadota bacterium]
MISPLGELKALRPETGSHPVREAAGAFTEVLSRTIATASDLQARADAAASALANGKTDDVHAVMVAMEEANLALQLAIQVRNKLLESYQDIIRMQV